MKGKLILCSVSSVLALVVLSSDTPVQAENIDQGRSGSVIQTDQKHALILGHLPHWIKRYKLATADE